MDRKGIHEKVAHALRSKKEPAAVKIRRPRRRAEQPPPSGEEQDEFEQLLHAQRSIYGDLVVGQEGAACAMRDEGNEDESDDDSGDDDRQLEFDAFDD